MKQSKFATFSEEEALTHTRFLKLIADPTRLRILSLLSQRKEIGVADLVKYFAVDQSNISHQLRLLRVAGLVNCRRDGVRVYYRLQREALVSAGDATNALIQSWIDGMEAR